MQIFYPIMFYIGAMFFESDFKRSSSFTNVNIWQEHGIEYTPLYNLGLIGSFKESIIFLMVFVGLKETFFYVGKVVEPP